MVSEATMKRALPAADRAFDTAARQAVEGVPCYMYGIRAPEDDELPVAVQRARDVPEDVRRIARMCITTDDIARAILAERKRCAAVAREEYKKNYALSRNDPTLAGACCITAARTAAQIQKSIESGQ